MVGSNGTMIAIRLVRSKLRKRDDHQHHHHHHHHHHHDNVVHPEQIQVVSTGNYLQNQQHAQQGIVNEAMCSSTDSVDSCCNGASLHHQLHHHQVIETRTSAGVAVESGPNGLQLYTTAASAEQFIWQFPPPYPPNNNVAPPQYALYNDQDTLVHGLQSADRQGFAKGFRKNLGGRWRRLVKRKPESETCAIPPELKDQLKTIYVY